MVKNGVQPFFFNKHMTTNSNPPTRKIVILWIPTIAHEIPKLLVEKSIDNVSSDVIHTNSKLFRISDFETVEENNRKYELLGKIRVHKYDQHYDIEVIIYKNFKTEYLDHFIRLRTELRKEMDKEMDKEHDLELVKELIKKLFTKPAKELVKKLADKLAGKLIKSNELPSARKYDKEYNRIKKLTIIKDKEDFLQLERVQTLKLTHMHSSHNGMMCYTYDYVNTGSVSNYIGLNNIGEIPDYVYHQIKTLFHEHEFHDSEADGIINPFFLDMDVAAVDELKRGEKSEWNKYIGEAVRFYLESFDKYFRYRIMIVRESLDDINGDAIKKDLKGIIKLKKYIAIIIVAIITASVLIYITCPTCTNLSLCCSCVTKIVLSCIIIPTVVWLYEAIMNYYSLTTSKILRANGFFCYASSLLASKYNCDNNGDKSENLKDSAADSIQIHQILHNVNNHYMIYKSYLEDVRRKRSSSVQMIATIMAVAFFIEGLIVSFVLDILTTQTISQTKDCILETYESQYKDENQNKIWYHDSNQ